ncbi:MAG: tRNA (guanosine(46)-N7)-methyltransferase TrmB [Muribaculaceae bacterium]|nr:tRNA (guanosine(46)-N7)-methyltransferase TrmB [Muribaculaceae bacterium]
MAKNKLKKFAEMEHIPFVFQFPFSVLKESGFALRGNWHSEFFHNSNPIVLELGCGKGEYTVGLARRNPDVNYIGIDIKGARMHSGATQALELGLPNVAFIRTSIELLPHFFAPGEVAEIWITFPDPQMKKVRKRLTSTRFIDLYRQVLAPGGRIHLKSDSPFLYAYTRRMALANPQAIQVVSDTADLYAASDVTDTPLDIHTHYENQWLQRGLKIKYLSFNVVSPAPLTEVPDEDIPRDTYRSYSRGELEEEHLR